MFESHLVRHWNSYPIEKSDGFSYCNNIWAKLEIIWNRITKLFRWNMKEIRWSSNIKIPRKATKSELSKLMMVRVAFCSALVFCYLVNKSLKISLECAPPVINFQREERTKANATLILQCGAISLQHFWRQWNRNTGGPPLTRKSLTRFPLPCFFAYVCASGVFWR